MRNDFPTGVFPKAISDYIRGYARAIGAPHSFVGMGVLAAATVCSAGRRLVVKRGYQEHPNLYMCIVAPKGWAKSPALKGPLRPLTDIQGVAARRHQFAMAEWQKELNEAHDRGERREIEARRPEEPVQYIFSSGTTEGLKRTLQSLDLGHEPPHLLYNRDELNGFFGDLNAYRQGAGSDQELFLSLYNGDDICQRNVGVQLYVQGATVSMVGGIQPEIFQSTMTDERHANGLFDRYLFTITNDFPPAPDPMAEVEALVQARYEEHLRDCFTMFRDPEEGDGEVPDLYRLTPGQQERMVTICKDYHGTGLRENTGAFQKWRINLHKLVLNLAVLHEETTVTDETFEKAVELNNYFIGEWLDSRDLSEDSPVEQVRRELVDWFKTAETLTERQIKRKKRYQRMNGYVMEALDQLIDSGQITRESVTTGGRPKSIYFRAF